jgi:hypothetical protein
VAREKDTAMASETYENILREVEQLTPEERLRLRDALTPSDHTVISTTIPPLLPIGAFAAALQMSEPIRPEVLDAMERAIEEDLNNCEW